MAVVKRRDVGKEQEWKALIREAARSGQSIREFCRERRVKEWQFYTWQRRLKDRRDQRALKRQGRQKATAGTRATFSLVSDSPGELDAGIELVLAGGRRIRISRGVDEATLRTVLSAVGAEPC